MKPTRLIVLVAIAIVSTAVGWAGVRMWESRDGNTLMVPWTAPGALAFLAVVLAGIALSMRARLAALRERRPGARRIDPLFAARAAVLAKASSLVGALIAGLYVGFGIFLLSEYDDGSVVRRRLLACGLTVAAALLVVAAALFLERVLRVPPEEMDETDPAEHGRAT